MDGVSILSDMQPNLCVKLGGGFPSPMRRGLLISSTKCAIKAGC